MTAFDFAEKRLESSGNHEQVGLKVARTCRDCLVFECHWEDWYTNNNFTTTRSRGIANSGAWCKTTDYLTTADSRRNSSSFATSAMRVTGPPSQSTVGETSRQTSCKPKQAD